MSKKTYDLDAKDFFWAKNAQNPFPHVAEEIDLELNKCVPPSSRLSASSVGRRKLISLMWRLAGTSRMRTRLRGQRA